MKIALITLHVAQNNRAVPLAAAMLASSLKKQLGNSLEIKLFNGYIDQDNEGIEFEINQFAPDIAGFSLYLWNRNFAEEMAFRFRQRNKDLITLAGGPEASAQTELLEKSGYWDIILKGESEESLCECISHLIKTKNVKTLPESLSHVHYIENCRNLPSPYLDGTLLPEEMEGILWELSRGCPFRCAFCFESRGKSGIRAFSEKRIEKELLAFNSGPPKEIFVLDPTFNYQKERAVSLLNLIILHGSRHHYSFEIRFEYLDDELADLFSQLNCSLQIGIQSIHREVLTKINRSIQLELLEEKCDLLNSRGLCFGFDLIFGLPGDSPDMFRESVDYCVQLQPNHIDLFPLSVLPGTKLAETAEKLNLSYLNTVPYTVTQSDFFSPDDMKDTFQWAALFDLFYNKGKAVPWFVSLLNFLELSASELMNEILNTGLLFPSENGSWKEILDFQLKSLKIIFAARDEESAFSVLADLIRYIGIETSLHDGDWDTNDSIHSFQRDPEEIMAHLESGVEDFGEIAFFLPENPINIDFNGNG